MSAPKNLAVDLGATFKVTVTVKDAVGPVDLTGYKALFKIRDKRRSPQFQTYEITPTAEGVIAVVIPDEETGRWAKENRTYVLDLEAPNGEVTRLMFGNLETRSGL
jgi:hypothetical protein